MKPPMSNTSLMICGPAVRLADSATLVQLWYPPVLGIATGAESTVPNLTCIWPVELGDAT